ncbi:DUF86 domain-containing protein [Nibrella viscosa]|uniref:DUF86 domain-containing protein n=1 Tax=Nibrella viscosa TaxID=1084524 RepID=A0ABP8K8J3_9BACT
MQQSSKNDLVYCLRILESIGKITLYTRVFDNPLDFFFANDQKDFNASLLLLINIGEQSARISAATREKYPQVLWQKIKQFRNVAAHDYTGVDKFITYDVIKVQLPLLRQQIQDIVRQELRTETFDRTEYNISRQSDYYKHIDYNQIDA